MQTLTKKHQSPLEIDLRVTRFCPSLLITFYADDAAGAEPAKEPIAVLEHIRREGRAPTNFPTSCRPPGRFASPVRRRPQHHGDPADAVSAITKEMMDLRGIELRVENLGLLSPGVYSPTIFGVAGVPTIRGDQGEVFQERTAPPLPSGSLTRRISPWSRRSTSRKAPAPRSTARCSRSGGLINLVDQEAAMFGKNETTAKLLVGDPRDG